MTTPFSWRDAPDLMDRLTAAQNALATPIDIMTFADFCTSRAELLAHVERYEARAKPAPRRRKARGIRMRNMRDLDKLMGW